MVVKNYRNVSWVGVVKREMFVEFISGMNIRSSSVEARRMREGEVR